MLRLFSLILLFGLLPITSNVQAGTEPIVTTDLLRIRSVSTIDVSREGQRAVCAVRSIASVPTGDVEDPGAEPEYQNQSHLYLLDLVDPASSPRQVTFGERNDHSPLFSPDGKSIAFVREALTVTPVPGRNHKAQVSVMRPQVWILPLDGGEARQLTDFHNGCNNPRWSPSGRSILVSSAVSLNELEGAPAWSMERPKRTWNDAPLPAGVQPKPDGTREQIRAWLDRNAQRGNPNVINRIDFQEETELKGEMHFDQLYLVDAMDAQPMVTQHMARRLTNGFVDHSDGAFMPDGQSVVYAAKKPVDQHLDRVLQSGLYRVNIDGSNDRPLLSMEGWSLDAPKPSRDGMVIGFIGRRLDEPAFRQGQIGLASIKGETASDPVWMTDETIFPASVNQFEWSATQSAAIVFTCAMRGGFPLMTISAGLVQPAPIVSEENGRPIGVGAFAVGGGSTVYSVTSAANPCVLKVRDGRGERLALDLNPWVHNKNVVLPTLGEIARPDGTKIQYWLMEPTNREIGPPVKKYPLCLQMHGGPMAMWGPGELTMWHEFQLLCSWGYGVVYCNPRGSGGYGYAFQKANFQDWGDGPAGDVLAAVDQAVLKEWVDADKLVITGGSYAGYLTAWVIAHDRRFKAAVAQRGVYDFNAFFGEGNAWRLVGWAMGGNPFDPRFKQIIERNNVFNYVARIKTPLLIMHGSQDLRTGVSQSEMMYRALKELNQQVEYVRHPGAGHELSRSGNPMQRMDRLNRIIEFFERFIENQRPAPMPSSN